VGLAETKRFAEGYEAIFGKKKPAEERPVAAKAPKKKREKREKKK
jgi:hypothetical protein